MKKVYIIHGFQSNPNGGWRTWLMDELSKFDVYACALPMPNPNNPVPAEWVAEIARVAERDPKDKIYLVGHSLGVPAILKFLEKTKTKNVKGIVLVSGPVYKTSKKKVQAYLKDSFDFVGIRNKVKKIAVIHGDNDQNVSFEQGEFLAKELKGKLIEIKNGGHLNGSSGWVQLPQCLEVLEGMMK